MSTVRSLRSIDSRAPAVTRAIALVEELTRLRKPLGTAELARSLGLAKSTVANLCNVLAAVSATLLAAQLTPELRDVLVADLTTLAHELSRTTWH